MIFCLLTVRPNGRPITDGGLDFVRFWGSSEKLASPTARLMRGWLPPTVNPDQGLRPPAPPAQGCEERATLGNRANRVSTPTGLWPRSTPSDTIPMGLARTGASHKNGRRSLVEKTS